MGALRLYKIRFFLCMRTIILRVYCVTPMLWKWTWNWHMLSDKLHLFCDYWELDRGSSEFNVFFLSLFFCRVQWKSKSKKPSSVIPKFICYAKSEAHLHLYLNNYVCCICWRLEYVCFCACITHVKFDFK